MKRFDTLDAFRGLAAMSVILLHYTVGYREDYGHVFNSSWDFTYGYLGVQFFFIISGFVIFFSLSHSKSTFDFYYKRYTRLYPTFWTCLFITFFAVLYFGLPGREKDMYELKANLTMIPKMFGVSPVDGAYWSLIPEFFFYIIIGLIFFIRRQNVFIVWGVIVLLLSWINVFVYHFPVKWEAALNLKWGALFFAGILFCKMRFSEDKTSWITYALLVASFITCCINLTSVPEYFIVGSFYILFLLFAKQKLEWLRWKPLVFIGRISFPLYLLHQNVGFIILNFTKPYLAKYPVVFILLPIAIITALAWAIHRFVEIPSMNYLRHFRKSYVIKWQYNLTTAFRSLF